MQYRDDPADRRAKLVLVEGIKSQITEIDRQIARLEKQKRLVEAAQHALVDIESTLRRMAQLAREAAQAADDERAGISREFDALKLEIALLVESAGVDGQNLLSGNLMDVQNAVRTLDRQLREREFC